jgi:hypothetical protein
MLIGIFGFIFSTENTTLLSEIPPTEIETSFKISHLQLGLVFPFLAMLIIIIDFWLQSRQK